MEVPLKTEFDRIVTKTGIYCFFPMSLTGNVELLIWLFKCNLINSKLTFSSSHNSSLFSFTITRQACGVLLTNICLILFVCFNKYITNFTTFSFYFNRKKFNVPLIIKYEIRLRGSNTENLFSRSICVNTMALRQNKIK